MHNFKLLIRSIAVMLVMVFLISTVLTYPYFYGETYHYQDGYVRDSLAGNIDLIICGASQAQRGINPHILDKTLGTTSYNIASPLLTFQAKYTLLKKEIKRNPVKTVILEVCYDSMVRDRDEVGAEGDYYMMGRFTNPIERLGYFFSCARIDEYADFYYDMLDRGIKSWKTFKDHKKGSSDNYKTRGFAPLPSEPVPMIEKDKYYKEEILTKISTENEYYLFKIFELCMKNNIEVVMVATPLSDSAILSYDSLDEIQAYYCAVAENFDVPFYNFSLYKQKSQRFSDKTAYIDRNHIGDSAADDFTQLLAQTVKDSISGKDLSELFYPDYKTAQKQIEKLYK